MEPMIVAGYWCFCENHGLECCHRCFCDYRPLNNMRIEEAVEGNELYDEDDQIEILEGIEDRTPVQLYLFGHLINRGNEPTVQCYEHRRVDCSECFDFVQIYLKAIGMLRPGPRASVPSNSGGDATDVVPGTITNLPVPESNPFLRNVGEGRLPAGARPKSRMRRNAIRPKLSEPSDPRRFIPPSPSTCPLDLFIEKPDHSLNAFKRYFHRQDDTIILVFTDGACLDQGVSGRRRGGWGFVYNDSDPGVSNALEGTVGGAEQTSNRAELRAVIGYLQMRIWEAGGANKIVIATDSEYVVEGVCGRLDKWIARGWKTAANQPVANRDLWAVLKRELDSADSVGLDILFWRIPRRLNGRADVLAKKGADEPDRLRESTIIMGVLM